MEADVNSGNSKSSNGRKSSNSKNYYVETKILKHLDDKENKMIRNNRGYDGENSSETRELQQQKYGNTMPIANNRSQCQSKNRKSSRSARNNDRLEEMTKMETNKITPTMIVAIFYLFLVVSNLLMSHHLFLPLSHLL